MSRPSLPAPRTTTGTDVHPPSPATRPAPVARQPRPTDDGGGRVISRPTPQPDSRPAESSGKPVRRDDVIRSPRSSTPVGDRYRPTQPANDKPAARVPEPVRKPNPDARPASPRYTPRDGVRPDAPRATDAVRSPIRVTSPAGSVATRAPSTSNGNVALSPRAGAPRLSLPQARSTRGITSGVVGQRSYGHDHGDPYGHCHTNYWHGYWDPCHSSWSHCGSDWVIGSWCGSFGWQMSFYYPFWSWRSHCWNSCYQDTLWCSWSQPQCTATNYWWYPSSSYCPSYLYVPSTVVYYETAPAAPEGGGASSEVVVAGGSVVGSARARDIGPGTEDATRSLAAKYVELGDFYFRAARFHDAAEAYAKARSYAPDDASVHFVLADAVFAEGDWHYAAFLIAEALRLDPALASADTDKRTFYGDPAAFDAQMAALQSYLGKNEYDAQAWLVRGYNLAFSRNATEAIAAFERVRTIDPENRAAQLFLAALRPAPADERRSY